MITHSSRSFYVLFIFQYWACWYDVVYCLVILLVDLQFYVSVYNIFLVWYLVSNAWFLLLLFHFQFLFAALPSIDIAKDLLTNKPSQAKLKLFYFLDFGIFNEAHFRKGPCFPHQEIKASTLVDPLHRAFMNLTPPDYVLLFPEGRSTAGLRNVVFR